MLKNTETLHEIPLEFSNQEFADLEDAAKAAGFESVGAFIAASTQRATRSRRIARRIVPDQLVPGFPLFETARIIR